VPRLRMDQLMKLAWKFLVPLTLVNLLVAAAWHYSGTWAFTGALTVRWLLCGAAIGGTYVALGRGLHTKHFAPRAYRYAD
jgi:NADH-quinone oxidoreductase subunit H